MKYKHNVVTKKEMKYKTNILGKKLVEVMSKSKFYKQPVSISYFVDSSDNITSAHVFGNLKAGGYVSIFSENDTDIRFSYNTDGGVNYNKDITSITETIAFINNPTSLAKPDTKKDELIGAVVVAVNRNDTRGLEITLKTTNGKKFVMNQH